MTSKEYRKPYSTFVYVCVYDIVLVDSLLLAYLGSFLIYKRIKAYSDCVRIQTEVEMNNNRKESENPKVTINDVYNISASGFAAAAVVCKLFVVFHFHFLLLSLFYHASLFLLT